MQPVLTLWIRELIRFYRQPSRVVGALGTPLVFWLLIGSGIGKSFKATSTVQNMDYLVYFFPGTILMIVLFTAIFSTISLIEDRKEGFLQSVLVAPIPRSSFVLGKILGRVNLGNASRFLISPFGTLYWYPVILLFSCGDGCRSVFSIFWFNRSGIHHCLETSIHTRLSCHYESFLDAALVSLRCALPARRCPTVDARSHEMESLNLWHGLSSYHAL